MINFAKRRAPCDCLIRRYILSVCIVLFLYKIAGTLIKLYDFISIFFHYRCILIFYFNTNTINNVIFYHCLYSISVEKVLTLLKLSDHIFNETLHIHLSCLYPAKSNDISLFLSQPEYDTNYKILTYFKFRFVF